MQESKHKGKSLKLIHRIRIILANFFFWLSIKLEPEITFSKEDLDQMERESSINVDKIFFDDSMQVIVKGFRPISVSNKPHTTTDQDMDDMVRGFLIGKEDKK